MSLSWIEFVKHIKLTLRSNNSISYNLYKDTMQADHGSNNIFGILSTSLYIIGHFNVLVLVSKCSMNDP